MKIAFLVYLSCFSSIVFASCPEIENKWRKVYEPFDSLVCLLEKGTLEERTLKQEEPWINQLYTFAHTRKDLPVLLSRAMYWDARFRKGKGDIDSTMLLIKKATALLDTIKYGYDYHRLQYLATNLLIGGGKWGWVNAYKNLKVHHAFFKEEKDTFMIANTLVSLGNTMANLKEYNMALSYYTEAQNYYKSLQISNYYIKNKLNLSNTLNSLGRKKEGMVLLTSLITDNRQLQDTAFYINVLFSACTEETENKTRYKYAFQAYDLAKAYRHDFLLAKATINKAAAFFEMKQPDSALIYYQNAKLYATRHKAYELWIASLEGLLKIYSEKQQWDSAFTYLNTYNFYKDSLSSSNNISEINRLEALSEIKKYETELQQATEKAKFHRVIMLLTLFFITCLATFVCLLFWAQRKKERIKKQLKESENRELLTRLENEKLQNERFQTKIDSQNRELASNTLMMTEKNQMLRELLARIEAIAKAGELPSKTTIELRNQIKGHLGNDNEWQFFKIHFDKVHPKFFLKLKEISPQLSEGELRFCAYIRTGMENKQIAQMLSLQPDTIKKSRYRIRKKLELDSEDSLDDFLRSL